MAVSSLVTGGTQLPSQGCTAAVELTGSCSVCCWNMKRGHCCFFTTFPVGQTARWLPARLVGKLCEEQNFSNPHEALFPREFARIEIVLIFNQDTERFTPSPSLPLLDPQPRKVTPPLWRVCSPPSLPAASLPGKPVLASSSEALLSGP